MLHIGKTGGTALKYVIRRHGRTPERVVFAHRHRVTLADLPPWDDFFFFVRDPADRFVSGFNSRLREGSPRYVKPWTSREKEAFSRFRSAEELALALGSQDLVERSEARRAMTSIRHVRSDFSTWLGSEKLLRRRQRHVLLVGRLETLDDDFEKLKRLLDIPHRVSLPTADRVAHKDPGAAPKTLSERARANLQEWYAADYRLLRSLEAGRVSHLPKASVKSPPGAD
jgi:hypothetical protein